MSESLAEITTNPTNRRTVIRRTFRFSESSETVRAAFGTAVAQNQVTAFFGQAHHRHGGPAEMRRVCRPGK